MVAEDEEDDDAGYLQVAVRVRPLDASRGAATGEFRVHGALAEIHVQKSKFGPFAAVLEGEKGNSDLFEALGKPIVERTLKGYNGTIMAYGQTGSGKTFTMGEAALIGTENEGVAHRMVRHLYATMLKDTEHAYEVNVSCVQVYCEQIHDLLAEGRGKQAELPALKLREEKGKGVVVAGCSMHKAWTADDGLAHMRAGAGRLAKASTLMNKQSSRAHTVYQFHVTRFKKRSRPSGSSGPEFIRRSAVNDVVSSSLQAGGSVTLEQWEQESIKLITEVFEREYDEQESTRGVMTVVDLAGSEDVGRSGVTGVSLAEAKKINTSLLALGNVIQALTSGGGKGGGSHVPFRNSVLTRMLQQSIGGNCKTTLLCCCSPADGDVTESLSTLRFGARAKLVRNHAVINATHRKTDLLDPVIAAVQEQLHGAKDMLQIFAARVMQLAVRLKRVRAELAAATGELGGGGTAAGSPARPPPPGRGLTRQLTAKSFAAAQDEKSAAQKEAAALRAENERLRAELSRLEAQQAAVQRAAFSSPGAVGSPPSQSRSSTPRSATPGKPTTFERDTAVAKPRPASVPAGYGPTALAAAIALAMIAAVCVPLASGEAVAFVLGALVSAIAVGQPITAGEAAALVVGAPLLALAFVQLQLMATQAALLEAGLLAIAVVLFGASGWQKLREWLSPTSGSAAAGAAHQPWVEFDDKSVDVTAFDALLATPAPALAAGRSRPDLVPDSAVRPSLADSDWRSSGNATAAMLRTIGHSSENAAASMMTTPRSAASPWGGSSDGLNRAPSPKSSSSSDDDRPAPRSARPAPRRLLRGREADISFSDAAAEPVSEPAAPDSALAEDDSTAAAAVAAAVDDSGETREARGEQTAPVRIVATPRSGRSAAFLAAQEWKAARRTSEISSRGSTPASTPRSAAPPPKATFASAERPSAVRRSSEPSPAKRPAAPALKSPSERSSAGERSGAGRTARRAA